ncbi:MAG: Phosphoglycerate kinase [Parcubacteria group bacterium GW2011_GWA2_47_21]|nr:MAG: Phosphoglycerate kinase [Parcubacteria group bacterium GW2011_GWA2_47_21]
MIKIIKEAVLSRGRKVLLRLDLNVPISNGSVADDFRLKAVYPTLRMLRRSGAKTVIISHADKKQGLLPLVRNLGSDFRVEFFESADKTKVAKLKAGEFGLIENIRFESGEELNDVVFAKQLSSLGDIFINEAFSASHRAHASIVGVPKFLPSFAGLRFGLEIENLSKAFHPPRPALLILGGAKADIKLPVAAKFLENYDAIFIGGALANNFFKFRGLEVGQSRVSEKPLDLSSLSESEKVILPEDVLVSIGSETSLKDSSGITKNERVVDVGNKTLKRLEKLMAEAKFIIWNGPLGIYEEGLKMTTEKLANTLAQSGAYSIVGGGDTLATIKELGILDKFGFVSTGGGAMLHFLAHGTLPGIEALEHSFKRQSGFCGVF